MKTTQRGLLGAAPGIAVLGALAASLGVTDAGSRLAVSLLSVLGLLATLWLARVQRDPGAKAFLRDLMLVGAGGRLLLFALIQQSVGPYVFAPDQYPFESLGLALSRNWAGLGPVPSQLVGSLQVAYPTLNALAFTIFGDAKGPVPMLNIFLSTWTAIPAYHLALTLLRGNVSVARWAAGLTTFFPSLMLWSVLNVREAPAILVLVSGVLFFVRFQRGGSLWDLVGAALMLLILTLFREYLTVLVGVGASAGVLMGKSRSPGRALFAGSLVLMVLALAAERLDVAGALIDDSSLETLQYLRLDMARGAGSAYGTGADVSTLGGALAFLPVGLAYFLLAPFPWSIGSTLQAITLPETLIWYAVIPFALWGAWLVFRHDLRAFTVPLSTIILVTFAYALVEGNVGTAYRHRAQILPLVFVFAAIGIRDAWAVYTARRRERRAAVKRAIERQRGGSGVRHAGPVQGRGP